MSNRIEWRSIGAFAGFAQHHATKLIFLNLALACTYFVLGRLAQFLAIPPGYAMAIYPPAGIALGMVLAHGVRVLPGVALGSLLLNTWISWQSASGLGWLAFAIAAAIALGAAVQAAVGISLVRRFLGYPLALNGNREILLFMMLAGPIACLVNASVGVTVLWAAGFMPANAVLSNWATWWMGDSLGVVVFSPGCLILFGKPRELWRSRRISVMLPQMLSFLMLVFGYVSARNWEQAQLSAEFQSRARAVAEAFQARMEFHVESQKMIAGLFSNFGIISADQMRYSVRSLLDHSPELLAIEWAPLILDTNRSQYEAAMSDVTRTDFKIRERIDGKLLLAQRREEYVPITIVEPLSGNESVLGLDFLSLPDRKAAIQKARTSGTTAATEPLVLVQDKTGTLSSLLLTPAYAVFGEHGRPDRSGDFKGVVVSIFRPGEMLQKVLVNNSRDDVLMRLVDTKAESKPYIDQLQNSSHPYQWETNLQLGDRVLHFTAQPTSGFLSRHTPWVAWISLGGGMLFCGVIGMYLLMMSGRSFGIEVLVQKRTLELQESKWSLQSILDNAADGILTVQEDGRIALANRAAEQLLKRSVRELEGESLRDFLIDDKGERFSIESLRIAPFEQVEIVKNVRHVDHDGNEVNLELAISKVQRDEQPFFIVILHDLTERRRADKMKGEFVSAVSHELRTPLTSIRGSLGLVVAGVVGEIPEKAMKVLQLANNNAERLHTLINDLLDFEKLEYGGMLFKLEPVSLQSLLQKSVDYNAAYAEKFGVNLDLAESAQQVSINVDESRLIQVLSNLISNAIKFSKQDGDARAVVHILTKIVDERVRLEVVDHGIGISEEFRARIFTKFSQEDGSVARKYAGTGLGLSLSKAMVEKMNGSIGFDSVLGQGSVFWVEFDIYPDP